MDHELSLPVSHRVARREAGKSLRKAEGAPNAWLAITRDFIAPTRDSFYARERLSPQTYASIVQGARSILAGLEPIVLEEDFRGPTRTRPKGEQGEIRAVTRMGLDAERVKTYGLASVRLYANRKRVDFDYDMLGLDVTGHLLERTMQRDLASWSGRFAEVDAALSGARGIAVAWRYAFAMRALRSNRIAVPLGNGLMLGNLLPSRIHNIAMRVSVTRNGEFLNDLGRSHFHVPDYTDDPGMRYLRAAFATAVADDIMSLPQVDLRDALARFSEANADSLSRIGRSATWRTSALDRVPTFDDLFPEVERLSLELAGIVREHDLDHALNKGLRDDEAGWGSAGPGTAP